LKALSLKAFYETTLSKKERFHEDIGEPEVPRKRKPPVRFEHGSGVPSFPESAEDLYRRIYFEELDLVILAGKRYNKHTIVCAIRGNQKAFGGIQTIIIGD